MREMVGGCCVCSDDRGWPENPLVYCDGQSCTVAVHQACYGIVTVPTGPWYCRKCESQERAVKVKCELCPSKHGALKRTDNSGWAHVVCALYIPEVRFGNVTTMEPIQLQLIPPERFNKACYICEEKGKPANASVGACMQCNKAGCKQQFHVTCAQGLGLLCEEAGNYLDNVKYCGYCQHHYSKLKKGGNVKTIPPYKPVSENHLSDSNSEKETESNNSSTTGKSSSSTTASGKRKSSSSSKTSSSSSSKSTSTSKSSSSSSSNTKTAHNSSSSSNSSKNSDKPKVSNSSLKSAKSTDESVSESTSDSRTDKKDLKPEAASEPEQPKQDIRDSKSSKKRKTSSRTPTPVSVVPSDSGSVVVSVTSASASAPVTDTSTIVSPASSDKKDTHIFSETLEKPKKARIETTQSILINQPVVALTSISTIKSTSPATSVADAGGSESVLSALPTQSIIHSSHSQPVNSLVVSVPLANTSLSPHPQIVNNQTSVVTSLPTIQQEGSSSSNSIDRRSPLDITGIVPGITNELSNNMLTSEMSGGSLKIAYEKQEPVSMEVDMELEVSPNDELPAKRSRSQSTEKLEKGSRNKKRNNNTNSMNSQLPNTSSPMNKRSSRSQQSLQLQPQQQPQPQPGAFASISQSQIKDSPPSSPSSESQGATSTRSRTKNRKSAPAAVNVGSGSSKDSKDIKLFQNGLSAPHMLGNQLNPNSNMAQKMSDHLNSELEAHSIFNPNEGSNLVGPQLHHRVVASARASSTTSSTGSGGSGLSSMLGGGGGTIPQTLDQLLERQWEQGSQFLMEQAQHFDIASLLSCLHQLRAENLRLEEHVTSLIQRRDHLLAVNARLAIPLTGQPVTPQSTHNHTVNNIHPSVANAHADVPRSSRHSTGSSSYPPPTPNSMHPLNAPVENGLPPEQSYPHSHRSPASTSQPQRSPTVRHSPAGTGFSSNSLVRQNADTSGRSAPRPQPYHLYQGPGSSSQQQMVIRRDHDIHHQPSTKPS